MNESKPKFIEDLEVGPVWPEAVEIVKNGMELSIEEFKRLYLGNWDVDHQSGSGSPRQPDSSSQNG